EFVHGHAGGAVLVGGLVRVLVTDGNAARHDLVVGNPQVLLDDVGIVRQRRLRARIQTAAARHDHDVLQEHAVVEPAALVQVVVDGKQQHARRAKEFVVAPVLAGRGFAVALLDAQQAVQAPAGFAAAVQVGAAPVHGVILVFAPFAFAAFVSLQQG